MTNMNVPAQDSWRAFLALPDRRIFFSISGDSTNLQKPYFTFSISEGANWRMSKLWFKLWFTPYALVALIWALSSDLGLKSKLESRLKRLCRPLQASVFRGLQIVCFQRPLKTSSVFSNALKNKLKGFSALLSCKCSASHTCRVASSPCHSLQTYLLSSLLPQCLHTLVPDRAATPTLAFSSFSGASKQRSRDLFFIQNKIKVEIFV